MLTKYFDYELFLKALKNLPIITKNISIVLLRSGWFIDFRNKPEYYAELAQNNDLEELDRTQIEYFKDNLKRIEKLSVERFPNRKVLISRAFKAHRKQDYDVSIILMLKQIDGIFRDISKKTIFSSKEFYGPINWIEQLEKEGKSELLLSALSPLRENQLLSCNFEQGINYPNNIHRNAILHGYEIDFGNEINSFKTISLINYIVSIVYNIVVNDTLLEKD